MLGEIIALEPFITLLNLMTLLRLRLVNHHSKHCVEAQDNFWQRHYLEIFGHPIQPHLSWFREFLYRHNTCIISTNEFLQAPNTYRRITEEPQIAQLDHLQGFFIRRSSGRCLLSTSTQTIIKDDIVKMAIGPQYRFLLDSSGQVWLLNLAFENIEIKVSDVPTTSYSDAVDIVVGLTFGAILKSNGNLIIYGNYPLISPQLTTNIVQVVAKGNHLAVVNTSGQLSIVYIAIEPDNTSFSLEESAFTDIKMMALAPNNLFILDSNGFLWTIHFDEQVRSLGQPTPVCPLVFSRIISGSHAIGGSDVLMKGIIAITNDGTAYYIVNDDVQLIETPDLTVVDACVGGSAVHLVAIPKSG